MFRFRLKKLLWPPPQAFVFTISIHLDFGPLTGPPRPDLRAELGAARAFEVGNLKPIRWSLELGVFFFCNFRRNFRIRRPKNGRRGLGGFEPLKGSKSA